MQRGAGGGLLGGGRGSEGGQGQGEGEEVLEGGKHGVFPTRVSD